MVSQDLSKDQMSSTVSKDRIVLHNLQKLLELNLCLKKKIQIKCCIYTEINKTKSVSIFETCIFNKNYINHIKIETFTGHFLNLKRGLAKETEL